MHGFLARVLLVALVAGVIWQGLALTGLNGMETAAPGVPASAGDAASVAGDATFALIGLAGGGFIGNWVNRLLPGHRDADLSRLQAGWWRILGGALVAAALSWVIGTTVGLAARLVSDTVNVAALASWVAFLTWPLAASTVVMINSATSALSKSQG